MPENYLFMLLLGCSLPGRNTEQHDVFFGIGKHLKDLIPSIQKFWPEAKGNIHIDAWKKVTTIDAYKIAVFETNLLQETIQKGPEIFFINLGGYKENEFEEFHYKMLVVAHNMDDAKSKAKKNAFFKHASVTKTANYPNATAHIDDKFGIDIDDSYKIRDILASEFKEKYRLDVSPGNDSDYTDELHLGYFRLIDL